MANREKGELSLTADGKDYTLVLNTSSMVALEELFSTPDKEVTWDQILARVNAGSVRYVRAFIWGMLRKYHPEMTIDATGELIDSVGGFAGLTSVLMAANTSATPDKRDIAAIGAGASTRPRKAQAKRRGTGVVSTARLAS